MTKINEDANRVIKSALSDVIDSISFSDEVIELESIPEVMKYRDFAQVIKEKGIDDKFTRAKFHFYQDKGLVSKGEKLKENQARYTRDQFYEYAFAHEIAEYNSIENAVSIIRQIRPVMEETGLDFKDFIEGCRDTAEYLKKTIPEIIQGLFNAMLAADDSTQFSEQEHKGFMAILELSFVLSYQKFAAEFMKKYVLEEGGEQL